MAGERPIQFHAASRRPSGCRTSDARTHAGRGCLAGRGAVLRRGDVRPRPNGGGDIGILANHSPLLAELAPYDVKIHAPGGDVHFPIAGGFMSVKDNKVIILAAGALEV